MNPQDMKPKHEPWYRSKTFKRFRRNPLAITGTVMLIIFVVVAFLAPAITAPQLATIRSARPCVRNLGLKRGEVVQALRNPLKLTFWRAAIKPPKSCYNIPRAGYSPLPKPPSKEHPFGLTSGSYDILYGLTWGARTAFYIGFLVVGISLAIGIVIGGVSGFLGGWVDNLIMRVVDVMLAFPRLVFVMIVSVIFGSGLTQVMLALAVVGWVGYARFFRGDILKTKAQDFVDAARALGSSPTRIFFKHVVPNSIGTLLILASMDVGSIVLTAAGLSFLGLGAPVGYADWGQMISFARGYILGTAQGTPFDFWYVWIFPSVVLVLFGLAWNLLGDAVRDALDPKS